MIKELTVTNGDDQFYPTPKSVSDKMLACIDCSLIGTVLEPSAGKGDLADAFARKAYLHCSNVGIDCVEIDPNLRSILKYNFSDEKRMVLAERFRELDNRNRNDFSEDELREWKNLRNEIEYLRKVDVRIVHDDFLTYRSHKHYDLILMNPPFSEGAEHLLRAINMQSVSGGRIICLINAETIRNPYTATRKLLVRRLEELGADIQYIDDAFSSDAERKADVDCAIINVNIEVEQRESTIWERMKKTEEAKAMPDPELHAMITGDYIEQAIQLYNTEVAATMELVKTYCELRPHLMTSLNPDEKYSSSIIHLVAGDDNYIHGFRIDKYMKMVRLKYWNALFSNKDFIGRLTSELQDKFRSEVDRMKDYEFSAFNIKQVLVDMNASIQGGIEKAFVDLFEKLTAEHSWYPEMSNNIHYYNGWKTNKAHKIGAKCIIPTCGVFSSYSWHNETFDVSTAYKVISDIEKVFDYLKGEKNESNLLARLKSAEANGQTRSIECAYFKIDLFKKGTTHIKFKPDAMELVDKLNIYASRKKGWLPPNYGKTRYADMEMDERDVIDSFHGDGTDGSGCAAYETVMARKDFYFAEPGTSVACLPAAQ